MRAFKFIANLNKRMLKVLHDEYGITDSGIYISEETVNKILNSHSYEFEGVNPKTLIADIIKHIEIVQLNGADDTVRLYATNRNLFNPVSNISSDKYLYIVLRLSNKHEVNFVKSLHPRRKLKEGVILWSKERE